VTRAERVLVAFCGMLLTVFIAEHVFLVIDAQRHPAQLIEACPSPTPVRPTAIKP
jgi:hypothetical protein